MSLPVAPNPGLSNPGLNGLLSPLSPLYSQLGNNGGGGQYGLNGAIAGTGGGNPYGLDGLLSVSQGAPPQGNPGFSGSALNSFVAGGAQPPPMAPDVNYPSEMNQTSQMSPLDQLLAQEQAQMAGIGNISNYEMPYSQIQSMAQNLTNAQYDPQINNLLGQIAQQKQMSATNQNYATQMYNALGDSYVKDIPAVQAQVQQEQQQTKDQYTNAQTTLQKQYDTQAAAQQGALDKLGIQAAQGNGSAGNANVVTQNAPGVQGVGEQQTTDSKYLQGQMALQQQQASNLLNEQGNSATQYQQSMADTSRLQGANDVQLLRNSLANYLTGANTQEQSLVGAKANALAGMEGQLNWQNIQNAQTQYQNAFNRVMAQNGFGLDVLKEGDVNTNNLNTLLAQLQMNQNQYGSGTVNRPGTTGNMGGPQGAATTLANQFAQGGNMNPQDMTSVMNAVNAAMSDANNQNNFNINHGMRDRTDTPFYNGFLQQELQKAGITNPNELAAAYQALLAYNQQLK